MSDPNGIILDYPEAEYHARPELSSTQARALLDSPARYRYDIEHRRESVAYDVGHAVHSRILGVGSPIIAYPDEHLTPSGNVSTKAATVEWAAEQRAAGLVPVSAGQIEAADTMAEAALAHPEARRLLELDGHSEVSVFATDPETGVRCRARIDRLNGEAAIDVKTTAGSASRIEFGREAARYGYPVQAAWYLDALGWAGVDVEEFYFLVIEKAAPHLVAVHVLDDVTMLTARQMAARARATYAECVASGVWPGYSSGVMTTYMPSWWYGDADDDEIEVD